MSKEQIGELAKVLKDYTKQHRIMASHAILEDYAEALYNEGYRKQREGEWIVAKTERAWNDAEYPYMHRCSLCGNEVASQDLTQYCSYCGAKMKGGGE